MWAAEPCHHRHRHGNSATTSDYAPGFTLRSLVVGNTFQATLGRVSKANKQDRVSGAPGSSSQAGAAFRQQHAPAAPGQVQQVPHPFNLSHLSAALSQPGPVQTPVVPQMAPHQAHHNMQADWERFQAQSQRGSPQPQLAPAPAQSGWASDFSQGKGKAREMPQHMEPMMHQPQMMPPNPFGGMGMMQQYQPRLSPMYQQAPPVAADHAKMEAAFEAALADARAQAVPQRAEPETKEEQKTEEAKTEEPKAEEDKPFKGDLEAVWESLKPEAERQNKLAEWESEFSQVSSRFRKLSCYSA